MLVHLVRFSVLDRPPRASLLFPLLEQTLALGGLGLLDTHNATVLVVLEMLLGETAARVMRTVVHNLRARTYRFNVRTSS